MVLGWGSKPTEDRTSELIELLREQQQEQRKFTESVIELLSKQQELVMKLLGQYITHGQNVASTLDGRLEEKELAVMESQWEPIPSPFNGM